MSHEQSYEHQHAARSSPVAHHKPHTEGSSAKPSQRSVGPGAEQQKQVRDLISILNSQTKRVLGEIDGAKASHIDVGRLDASREMLVSIRGTLMTAATHLPSGSPLQQKAFSAADRASHALEKLDALSRAHHGRSEVGVSEAQQREEDVIAHAREQMPGGYCDLPDAKQGMPPCYLSAAERTNFRIRVMGAIQAEQTNWGLAINSVLVDEKIAPKLSTIEKKLGGALLSLLFMGVSYGAGVAVGAASAKAAQMMTKEHPEAPGLWQGPTEHQVEAVTATAKVAIASTTAVVEAQVDKALTTKVLVERAKAAATVGVAGGRVGFLNAMKEAPNRWSESLRDNLPELLDADLAALAEKFRAEGTRSQNQFEEGIRGLLEKFDTQVMAVNHAVRPVKVITRSGVFHALVAPEEQPNDSLHGEWKGASTRTGKWHFVRWIEDQFADMALERAMAGGCVGDEKAAMFVAAASDSQFWDEKSLPLVAAPPAPKERS